MRMRFYFVLPLALGWVSSLTADIVYSVVDLGTLGGSTSGTAINNTGQVTGESNGHAFLYSTGQMTDLGTVPGYTSSSGNAINDSGQIAGSASRGSPVFGVPDPFSPTAFLYSNGQITTLGTLGGWRSAASGINDAGQVVGSAENLVGHFNPFLYTNGQISNLVGGGPEYFGDYTALDINNAGQVVGHRRLTAASVDQAFLYSNGQMNVLSTLDSFATGINDTGQVVGWSKNAAGLYLAFLYANGQMMDLGTLGWRTVSARASTTVDRWWVLISLTPMTAACLSLQ